MGRHRSRSRSRSPRRDRHRDGEPHLDEERHRQRGRESRRRAVSPAGDSHRHGSHRRRGSSGARSRSPPERHRDGERRHLDDERSGRGRSSEGREVPPQLPPLGSHRGSDADQGPLPPPPGGDRHGKRQSRFDRSPDEAHPAAALLQKPAAQEPDAVPEPPQEDEAKEPEPNFGLSGKLAAESNKVNGVVLLHAEPPEAANPQHRWRLYQFKSGKPFQDPLPIHRQSCYLFGRERRVADVPTDHPSCSKQHAVLQFRRTEKEGADGMMHSAVRPYIMDLGSVNGTFVNNERIEAERFYELLEQDMVRFGNSTREYVLLHEGSAVH